MPYFYRLTLSLDGKPYIYVGSTQHIEDRIHRHLRELRQGSHHNCLLQQIWNKEPSNLTIETEELDTIEEAREREEEYIRLFRNDSSMTNISLGVSGGDNLTRNPKRKEIIANMKNSLEKRYSDLGPEERKKIYGKPGDQNGMFGKKHGIETKKIMAEKVKERYKQFGHPMKGVPLSSEQKQKLSEARKGRFTKEENPFYGRKHTEETKEKLRQLNKGKLPPNTKPITIDGVQYNSVTDASRQLGISVPTVAYRVKSKNPKFNEYKSIDKCPTTIERVEPSSITK